MKTILLVEDEALIAINEAQMLKNHGFEVITAYNGTEAIETVRENEIDLILMDIDLGPEKMDGTEVAQSILQENDLPIVFLSGHTEREYVEKVKEITGYGYIQKNSGEFVLIESINMAFQLREREEQLERTNKTLRTLGNCNQALIRSNSEKELIESVCQTIVDNEGYVLAWVGFVDDKERSVVPIAYAGFENGYVEQLKIKIDEGPTSKGPTATAIRTQKPSIETTIEDDPNYAPWRESALKRGYRSSIALPLRVENTVLGTLNIYASHRHAFGKDEQYLLMELANDLAYGIENIRVKREKEQEKKLFDNVIENLPVGLQIFDERGYSYRINRKQRELLELSDKQEDIEQFHVCTDRFPGNQSADGLYHRAYNGEALLHMENEYDCGKQEKRYVDESIFPIFDSHNNVQYVVTLTSDITEQKRVERALRESKENLRITLDSIGDAVISTDVAGSVERMNPVAEQLTGWSLEAARGKQLEEVFHIVNAATGEEVQNPVKNVMQSGTKVGLGNHTMLISRNGETYQIADSAAPM